MTTKKPTSTNKKSTKSPARSTGHPKVTKRPKSTGFIENSNFKPNWLETGPLSPDMLEESLPPQNVELSQDEFEALHASLQRFYSEEGMEDFEADESNSIADLGEVVGEDVPYQPLDDAPAITPAPDPGLPAALSDLDARIASPPSDMNNTGSQPAESIPPVDAGAGEPDDLPPAPAMAEPAEWLKAIPGVGKSLEEPSGEPASASIYHADEFIEDYPDNVAGDLADDMAATESAATASVVVTDDLAGNIIDDVAGHDISDDYAAGDILDDEIADDSIVAATEFVEELEGEAPPDFEESVTPVAAPALSPKESRPKTKKRRSRLVPATLITSLLLLGAAALIYFVNPFSRLALGSASMARPVSSPTIPSPSSGSGEWCVRGTFLPNGAAPLRLIDSGSSGDIMAADNLFSLDHTIPQPGSYEWQVFDCNDPAIGFPERSAWITTTTPNQQVTFNFDSNERADPLFFPIPFVVSADDATTDFRVVGNFQDWNAEDASGILQRINLGIYQQVRRLARAGSYEAFVISGDETQAIDAYGRTTEPIPFAFETDRNGDIVVFLLDTDRGRASVLYDMPPVLATLAYGNGYWILSLVLVGLALLLLLGLILRALILNSKTLQMESGCPNCGRQELMRISRQSGDKLLHMFAIPAYRYRCRHCTWEGTRLSEEGKAVSPGVELARIDEYR